MTVLADVESQTNRVLSGASARHRLTSLVDHATRGGFASCNPAVVVQPSGRGASHSGCQTNPSYHQPRHSWETVQWG